LGGELQAGEEFWREAGDIEKVWQLRSLSLIFFTVCNFSRVSLLFLKKNSHAVTGEIFPDG
jgi:hypothetical protein